MRHEYPREQEFDTPSSMGRPPLRKFLIVLNTVDKDGDIERLEVTVEAHMVFDNSQREGADPGLIFRKYYDDSVRTEKVAQFPNYTYWKEI